MSFLKLTRTLGIELSPFYFRLFACIIAQFITNKFLPSPSWFFAIILFIISKIKSSCSPAGIRCKNGLTDLMRSENNEEESKCYLYVACIPWIKLLTYELFIILAQETFLLYSNPTGSKSNRLQQ